MSPARRRVRWASRTLAALVAAGLTVLLAQNPVAGAFTATTDDSGNSISAAASFCTTPGSTTRIAVGDSYTDQNSPTSNYDSDSLLRVRSVLSRNVRTWIRFDLPAVPAGCELTAATLRVYNRQPNVERVIDVLRGDPVAATWSETTINWANQPAGVGFPIGGSILSGAGWQVWGVFDHVSAQYAQGNNGFMLKDRNEDSSTQYEQTYDARQNTGTAAELVLDWG
ncbi:hypothetical protein IN07_05000 [Modestobacter caceresii]|uniref:Carbohydrate-binding module family 96 domain-containing protein n=1 Tax=Modestobacter caceresii TaxID=1522368 RepID=A0A098YBW7_9ACTN|nr:DNRLRE domain-containing protein [Modestobacter caceresii]KGH47972.1 hypothetical protein IN07_05000 [Modestobacter caceresii]